MISDCYYISFRKEGESLLRQYYCKYCDELVVQHSEEHIDVDIIGLERAQWIVTRVELYLRAHQYNNHKYIPPIIDVH